MRRIWIKIDQDIKVRERQLLMDRAAEEQEQAMTSSKPKPDKNLSRRRVSFRLWPLKSKASS